MFIPRNYYGDNKLPSELEPDISDNLKPHVLRVGKDGRRQRVVVRGSLREAPTHIRCVGLRHHPEESRNFELRREGAETALLKSNSLRLLH